MNKMKKSVKPNSVIIHPPKNGKMTGRTLPAPDNPVYKALFSLLVISSRTPLIAIV